MLTTLKAKDKAFLLEDVETLFGTIIPAGTKIRMANPMRYTAVIDILPYNLNPNVKFPIYKRVIVFNTNAIRTKVKRTR